MHYVSHLYFFFFKYSRAFTLAFYLRTTTFVKTSLSNTV